MNQDELEKAAELIKAAYKQFAEAVQPSIDLYNDLGKRAEMMREENEKIPL